MLELVVVGEDLKQANVRDLIDLKRFINHTTIYYCANLIHSFGEFLLPGVMKASRQSVHNGLFLVLAHTNNKRETKLIHERNLKQYYRNLLEVFGVITLKERDFLRRKLIKAQAGPALLLFARFRQFSVLRHVNQFL